MAPPEWTHSVRAVRDNLGADYSAPSHNTQRRVAYRPLITHSLFLLALSVFYFQQTLCRCGQQGPYIGMVSLNTRLHRDCNGKGDAAEISPRIPVTSTPIALLSLLIIGDCKVMGDAANISPRVPSTWVQNAFLSLLI
jgi:hypothetical protein